MTKRPGAAQQKHARDRRKLMGRIIMRAILENPLTSAELSNREIEMVMELVQEDAVVWSGNTAATAAEYNPALDWTLRYALCNCGAAVPIARKGMHGRGCGISQFAAVVVH